MKKGLVSFSPYTRMFKTLNGLEISGQVVAEFPNGYIMYAQERIAVVDSNNNELESIDMSCCIQTYLK